MNNKNKYVEREGWVWMDLEMTGLDEKTCVILQVAMIITDSHLHEIAKMDLTIWQPESALAQMSPVVRSMHTQNGVLKKVRSSEISLEEAEEQLMGLLSEHVAYQKGYLAGNSIYMDRQFLRAYMPSIASYLHYRQIDISTIKLLAQSWLKLKAPKKTSTHTALDDIHQSIEELKYLKDHCFKSS